MCHRMKIFLGINPARCGVEKVEGRQVVLAGEEFYCIANSDRLRPFFLSIVSSAAVSSIIAV